MKITINNEEVLCNKDFTINEEMLNTSSVILNNVYPVEWEQDKDYVSRFYYPKDYSKCKIFDEIVHPATREDIEGTNFSINVDTSKEYQVQTLKGQTSQNGTPTPTTPQPINITTGEQVVSVCGKNHFSDTLRQGVTTYNTGQWSNSNSRITSTDWIPLKAGTYTISAKTTITGNRYLQISCVTFDTSGNFYNISNVSGQWKKLPFTFTTPIDLNWKCNISFNDSYSLTPSDVYDIQLEKGNQATTYEEYKGNDYEINLGKNLLNPNGVSQTYGGITFTNNGDGTFTANGTATANGSFLLTNLTTSPITLEKNQSYTQTLEVISGTWAGGIVPAFKNSSGTISYNYFNSSASSPVSTKTTTDYMTCHTYSFYITTGNTITNCTFRVQLEKGNIPTSYSPYKTPIYLGKIGTYQDYIKKNEGKNLFGDLTNGYYDNNGDFQTTSTRWCTPLISKGDNTKLYFGRQPNSYAFGIVQFDANGNLLDRLVNQGNGNITFNTNTDKFAVFFYDTTSLDGLNIMVSFEPITIYEPYGEGQWYIHKEIGRVVLNGSESWNGGTIAGDYLYIYCNDYDNIFSPNMAYTGISTHFKVLNQIINTYSPVITTDSMSLGSDTATAGNRVRVKINKTTANTIPNFKTWLSTHNTEVYYVLNTPTNTLIEDEELINQLNSIELLEGLNNVSITSPYLPFIMSLMYNYQEGYTEEELYFCGVVENTGNISLNPRHPHYCNLQVLDFKTFLSEGETLDIVIYEKTILEAIEQIIGVIAPYGFVKGNINIYHADEMIGAYSTKDKTAYDVFNYIADITQSRWTTRMVDENTIAIDFYDPNLMPQGTAIQYNNTWFTNNKIIDMNFNYSSRDYRNKQVMLSGEVYSNVETTEIMVADGYQTQFNTTGKIGYVSNVLLNGTPASIITKEEYDLGYDGDFIYQPGNTYFESENLIPNGAIITIVYYAIIEGREVLLNQDEIEKINTMTNRKGVVARYETRNDATTTKELNQIGQSYLKYKGMPEITLKVESLENIWNIGERVEFNSPLEELSTEYMVKKKSINYITTQDNLFYTFELSSNFNSETEINYFDNQRAKTIGNIGSGEFISRNIDIENTANVIFYGLEVNEVQISGESTLQSELQTPLGVE